MRSIKFIGDSHVSTLSFGWAHIKSEFPDITASFYSRHGVNWGKADISSRDGAIYVYADAVKGERPIDIEILADNSFYILSSALHSAPTYRHQAWKSTCLPSAFKRHPEKSVVSHAMVETYIDRVFEKCLALVEAVKSISQHVYIAEPPKPLRRSPSMFGLAPDILIGADRVHRDYISRWAGERGVGIFHAPDNTYDEDGFTREGFEARSQNDPHHGNFLYGVELMRNIAVSISDV